MSEGVRFAVAGAGAIGGFVGGRLAVAGAPVAMLARGGMLEELQAEGLRLTDLEGRDDRLAPDAVHPTADPAEAFAAADVILVTTKSPGTDAMGDIIAAHAPETAVVVSLQNGVRNAERLGAKLPGRDVRAGMVVFNVAKRGPAWLHRGTEGWIGVAAGAPDVAAMMQAEGLDVRARDDMTEVLWSKTLLNLNNALNALSGLPLKAELLDAGWRKLFRASIQETLALLKKAGIAPAQIGKQPPRRLPLALGLPTPLFRPVLDAMMKIDAEARSSMADDLAAGRMTEIGDLQGEVAGLAARLGARAPVCEAVAQLIGEAERAGAGSPKLKPGDVEAAVRRMT